MFDNHDYTPSNRKKYRNENDQYSDFYRYNTQPVTSNLRPKRKMIESSVFLPKINNKRTHHPYRHQRSYSNPYQSRKKYSTIDDSQYQTMQCLQQCEKILKNLRRLTSASYKKQMRKKQRSYSLLDQDNGQKRNKYNGLPLQKQQKQIFHMRVPESPVKNYSKKRKSSFQREISASPVNSKQKKFNQLKIHPKNIQQSVSQFQSHTNNTNMENAQFNQFSIQNDTYQNQFKREPQQMNKQQQCKDNKIQQQDVNQMEQQVDNLQGKQGTKQDANHNQSIINKKKQKTLLKYLMRAKDRGSLLNCKVSTHINKKYGNRQRMEKPKVEQSKQSEINKQKDQNKNEKQVQNKDKQRDQDKKQHVNEQIIQMQQKQKENIEKQAPQCQSKQLQGLIQIDGETGNIVQNVEQYQKKREIQIHKIMQEQQQQNPQNTQN